MRANIDQTFLNQMKGGLFVSPFGLAGKDEGRAPYVKLDVTEFTPVPLVVVRPRMKLPALEDVERIVTV